jgi:hypothetical protein
MFERRALLTLGLAAALYPLPLEAATPPPGGRVAFDVMRKGKRIGMHQVVFSGDEGDIVARANCEMAVALGPVTVFRYRHSQVERWSGGRFASLETATTENGKKTQVSAKRTAAGVTVQGGAKNPAPLISAEALPLTHWNRAGLAAPLFNPQTGKLMRLSVGRPAPATIVLANGQSLQGTRVALSGEQTLEDWYDEAMAWAGLRAKAEDGSLVEYRRV